MKYILILLLLTNLSADRMKKTTIACPTVDKLKKVPLHNGADSLELDLYVIANGCVTISKSDKVEAIGYDPRNSQQIYQKIIYKKTEDILYVLRSSMIVEQGGKKSSIRF